MVDLGFVAAKLIEREKHQRQLDWQKRYGIMGTIVYRIPMTFKSHNVEVECELDSPKKFEAVLQLHLEAGFEKRVYAKKETPATFTPQQGTVLGVKPTDEKWNNKPLYAVHVELDDGNQTAVNVFDKNTFRKGDRVDYKVSDKGYPKLEHYGGNAADDDVPF